jgi:hypothetical protein
VNCNKRRLFTPQPQFSSFLCAFFITNKHQIIFVVYSHPKKKRLWVLASPGVSGFLLLLLLLLSFMAGLMNTVIVASGRLSSVIFYWSFLGGWDVV